MSDHPYPSELDFALQAVRAGSRLARAIQRDHGQERQIKSDRSPVTLADYGVQALVGSLLDGAFPHDPLVAEEDTGESGELDLGRLAGYLRSYLPEADPAQIPAWVGRGAGEPSDRFWTLDPVDGTKGFLRGGQYAVALALIEDGRVVLGALGCPNLNPRGQIKLGGAGSVAWAVRGAGAWIEALEGGNRRRLAVSSFADPGQARLLRSAAAEHTDLALLGRIQQSLGARPDPLPMDSQAKYLMLAAGEAELIFRLLAPAQPGYREKIWDQAAGSLLVTEAGGRVSDLAGRPLDFSTGRLLTANRGVMVSNGSLHSAALEALQRVQAVT